MVAFSLVGIIIVGILILFFSKIMGHVVKFTLYTLIILLIVVFFFGVSLNQVVDGVTSLVLWVF